MSSAPADPSTPPTEGTGTAAAGSVAPSAQLHIDGLSDTLAELRATLDGQRLAGRYGWVSGRLMVMRNPVIAFAVLSAVLSAVLIGTALLLREAWRRTLTITAFDVPASVAERGLTGEVLARHLFNELIKRRRTITSFVAGQLTNLSSERHSDLATADGRFSLQSLFRALHSLTGSEITISGEMLEEGASISLVARVSGKPQRLVSGPLQDWPRLLGELANCVFESTQPVLLAGYLGETARTPQDLARPSALIRRMHESSPPSPDAALARAYHAYGEALMRLGNKPAAQLAWAQARSHNPAFWRPYWSAATALWWDDAAAADRLVREAMRLGSADISRERLLHLRFNLAEVSAKLGQAEAAGRQFEAALQVKHAATTAQGTLAVLRLMQGQAAEAERLARQVADSAAGTNPYTVEVLARAVAAQGRLQEALKALRDAHGRFPSFCPFHGTAATLLLQAGRPAEALAQWDAGIKAIPRCDVNYLHAAQALIGLQRQAEARGQLEALLLASPRSDSAVLARPLLASLAVAAASR